MIIWFENRFEGGEVRARSVDHKISSRTLSDKISRFVGRKYPWTFEGWNVYTCPLRLPEQKIIISEILHLLPVILKYSPLIVTPMGTDSKDSLIFFKSNREIKIFSLQDGEYKNMEMIDLQKPYMIMSANAMSDSGFSKETTKILKATRYAWKGKLRFAFTNANTIRENLTPDKNLRATNAEMKTEATLRLTLLGHKFGGQAFIQDGLISASIQKNENTVCDYKISGEYKELIKNTECKYYVLVYYIHLLQDKNGEQELSMLYVGRNIDEWEQTRKRTLEGNPEAYIYNLETGRQHDLKSIGIKVMKDGIFDVLFRTN